MRKETTKKKNYNTVLYCTLFHFDQNLKKILFKLKKILNYKYVINHH